MQENATPTPKLYSKLAIVIFSIIGSTFFGVLLYGMNLRELGERKKIFPTLLFAMFYNFIAFSILRKLGLSSILFSLLANLIGGLILVFIFWKEQITEGIKFSVKPVWSPILALIILYGSFIAAYIYLYNNP